MRYLHPLWLAGTAFWAASAYAAPNCAASAAPMIASVRVSQPLVVIDDRNLSETVTVRADRCVQLALSHGDSAQRARAFRMPAEEFDRLRGELTASRAWRLRPEAVRAEAESLARMKSTSGARTVYRVSDDEIVELALERPGPLGEPAGEYRTWTGLGEQALNHPELESVLTVTAVRDRLLELRRHPKAGGAR